MSFNPELDKEPATIEGAVSGRRFPLFYVAVLLSVVTVGALFTGLFLYGQFQATVSRCHVLLSRVSEDTARSIEDWVQATSRQAAVMASFPVVADAITSNSPEIASHSSAILERVRLPFDYAAIYVVDSTGVLKVQTPNSAPLPGWLQTVAAKSSAAQTLTCFDREPDKGFPQLAFLVPVERTIEDRHERVGTLVILTQRKTLALLAEPPSGDSHTRSLFFAHGPEGKIIYLSRLYHLSIPNRPWVDEAGEAALRGETLFTLRRTADGYPQYVVTRRLNGLGWGMITREWRGEVLAPFWQTFLLSGLMFLVSAALLVTVTVAIWRHQQVFALQDEMQRRAAYEEELRQSEERFNKAFRSCPEGMSISRLSDGHFIEVNESFVRLCGYAREEIIGHSSFELGLWSDLDDRESIRRALQNNDMPRAQRVRGHIRNGSDVEVELSAEIIQILGEKCLLLILRDITHQLTLEEQLRQAQKMEAVGQLAGALAHDFNNLLMAISSQAELLLEARELEQVSKKARQILSATESAGLLTKKLLAFGRKQELAASTFDLNSLIAETADLVADLLPKSVQLSVRPTASPCWVKADRLQLEQTVVNLVLNARDAMPGGGRLVLSTFLVLVDEFGAGLHSSVSPGNYALITVADTGTGIAEQHLNRIFEPFFTTKAKERGTGLGLSIVYGIVKQSGGHIRVKSAVGAGTTFSVYIPSAEQPHLHHPALHPCPLTEHNQNCPRNGTILVVDDEDLVRTSVRLFLERSGFKVSEAPDAAEALKIASTLADQLVLLVTDVVMPGMAGTELAGALHSSMPELPVIFMSGYAAGENGRDHFKGAKFLQKPFSRAELLAAVCDGMESCPLLQNQA